MLVFALWACTPVTPLDAVESTLPLVVVDTQGHELGQRDDSVYDEAWTDAFTAVFPAGGSGVASVRGTPDYDGLSGIRVRGNSSRDYPKRSYRLELRDAAREDLDASLLGMPEEADWVLQAPYSDKSLMRNWLMYALSRDIGRYAARSEFVELYVVDDGAPPSTAHYRGIYVLMERIERDRERVAIAELDPPDATEPAISGGYLLKRDWLEDDEDGSAGDTVITTPELGDRLLLEDPRDPTAAQVTWITSWLGDFERALSGPEFADPDRGYRPFVDLDAFVDHMLLVELGRNVDGYVLSTWMSKDREGPLSMGPIWDYNGALGNADYFEAWQVEGWHYDNPEFPADNPNGFRWYARMLEDPGFRTRRAERWRMHRADALSDAAVRARIAEAEARLAGGVERNFARWDVLGQYVWPNDEGAEERESWAEEVDYLEDWVLRRLAWMDAAVDR